MHFFNSIFYCSNWSSASRFKIILQNGCANDAFPNLLEFEILVRLTVYNDVSDGESQHQQGLETQ